MIDQLERPGAVIALLFAGLLIFSAAAVACACVLPANEKIFALVAGVVGNFNGALFMYIQRRTQPKEEKP